MTTLQRFRSLCNAVQPVINRLWKALRHPAPGRHKGRPGWGTIEPLETRQLLSSLFVIGSEGADTINVQLSGGSTVQVYVNGVLYASDTVSSADTVTLNARGGNDTITVGQSGVTSVFPGTLRIHGGGGSDALTVLGQTTVTLDTNLPDVGTPGFGSSLSLTVQDSSVVNFPQNQTLAGLEIRNTARVNLTKSNVAANNPHKTLVIGSLQLLQGGTLDLTDNALIVHNGNRNGLTSHIARGRNNGNWAGSGIISSTITTQTQGLMMLGLLKNSDKQTPFTNFNGQGVVPGDVLIKYTYNGDATLDSVVDSGDYFRIDTGNITQEAA